MQENEARKRVIEIAHSWVGTPYHHCARVKKGGVDCLTLLAEVYAEAGLIDKVAIPYYPNDWHLHRSEEKYLQGLLKYTHEVTEAKPADIIVWKFGRCFSHGAIVVDYPVIIHAKLDSRVMLDDAEKSQWLKCVGEKGLDYGKARGKKIFSFWN